MNNIFCKVIDFVKIPLALLVLCMHMIGPQVKLTFVVPCFFFISGYLFFYNISERFDLNVFIKKVKSRIRTLVIPFVIWNLLYLVYRLLVDRENLLQEMDDKSWIRIFWDSNPDGGNPILGPLWYVRDLVKLCIISPVLFFVIKYLRYYAIIPFSFILIMGIAFNWNVGFVMNDTLAYFGLGSVFGFLKNDIMKNSNPLYILSLVLSVVSFNFAYIVSENSITSYWRIMYIVSMGILVFSLSARLLQWKNLSIPAPFDKSSFYIYCVHMFFYEFSFGIAYSFGFVHGTRSFAIPIAIIMCFITFYLLNMFCPKVLDVLCGYR